MPARALARRPRSGWRFTCSTRIATAAGAWPQRARAKPMRSIRNCERCRMLTEEAVCRFCAQRQARSRASSASSRRRPICWRSSNRAPIAARYFVLMGHLSPIDGIGPAELGLELLERRFSDGALRGDRAGDERHGRRRRDGASRRGAWRTSTACVRAASRTAFPSAASSSTSTAARWRARSAAAARSNPPVEGGRA